MEKQKVYMVQLDWSNDDDQGIETYLYGTKEKAKQKFYEIIQEDKTSNYLWSKDAFDENGNLNEEEYELETNIEDENAVELYWELKCNGNFYLHDFLELKEMEVQ